VSRPIGDDSRDGRHDELSDFLTDTQRPAPMPASSRYRTREPHASRARSLVPRRRIDRNENRPEGGFSTSWGVVAERL